MSSTRGVHEPDAKFTADIVSYDAQLGTYFKV